MLGPGATLISRVFLAAEEEAMVARYTDLPRKLRHVETIKRGDGGDAWCAIVLVAIA